MIADGSSRKPTKKGYMRRSYNGKNRMEHVVVWESHFGKIPEGYQIHHKDGDKLNNDIENLQLVTPLEHKRIHSGCKLIDGVWYKPCTICGEFKPCTEEFWYMTKGWIMSGKCKKCFIQYSLDMRKKLIAKGWKRKNYKKK